MSGFPSVCRLALPLGQLENGTALEDAVFLDLEIQKHAGDAVPGLVVFQQPEIGLYQRLVESARNRLAELEYGIEKSEVDFIRSKLGWATDINELLTESLRRFLESHSARVTEDFGHGTPLAPMRNEHRHAFPVFAVFVAEFLLDFSLLTPRQKIIGKNDEGE